MGLLDYLQEKGQGLLAGGAKPRAIVGGLLGGDTTALKGAWNEVKQLGDPAYMRKVKGISKDEAINIALNANPVFALSTGGKLADALDNVRPKTQYELAHDIAQKNAVEMLGLPANNTAMDRAKALGFDTHAYHGTSKQRYVETTDIPHFDESKVGDKWGQDSRGFSFTNNKNEANYYANSDRDYHYPGEGNGAVYPVMLNRGNSLNKTIPKVDDTVNFWDNNHEKLQKLALNKSSDSVILKDSTNGNQMTVMFNPNQIRSKFAAFDPARAHEADLLGNASPELLAYLSAGGLLGAGAYKYSQGNQ